ncbi:beta-L-arabinofuranosidase domain-containing protein [Lacticaseibacillus absianus]|uniref:beta-L-arabinofuranosidase domain-containing protein n=1 Tax=Lacticaseibacillus absianus TaxID=2729623 RepID=UPI0015C7C6B1|nr:beta-L-arabinofuranosidase domain-containing protein [Lacticaseibacillus absianus]
MRQEQTIRPAHFTTFPLGTIKPMGWLKEELMLQAAGLTGNLEAVWPDVGPNNGWLGGTGDGWERGPYYLDGLIPLAYALDDASLIAKAQKWIDWILASQDETGWFGPTSNVDWWSRMIVLKGLTQYQEATGDPRVIPFMLKYARYQAQELDHRPLSDWAVPRGCDNIVPYLWLYDRTHDAALPPLMKQLYAQSTDWGALYAALPFTRPLTRFNPESHIVNVMMGLKAFAVNYRLTGDPKQLTAFHAAWQQLRQYHGQAHGLLAGDEWLAGTSPSQGLELCGIVEFMFSAEIGLAYTGDTRYGDLLEEAAFNALPASISRDFRSHQYDQQVNQISCTVAPRDWTENGPDANTFGLTPHFGCCTANLHQGWPKFVAAAWMQTENAYVCQSLVPCTLETPDVQIKVDGNYPFGLTNTISVQTTHPIQLQIRIPQWASSVTLACNGHAAPVARTADYLTLECTGDQVITLTLVTDVRFDDRPAHALAVHYGPLLFAAPLTEHWTLLGGTAPLQDWAVTSTDDWAVALSRHAAYQRHETPYESGQAFDADRSPIYLTTTGQKVTGWGRRHNSAEEPPFHPELTGATEVRLVPYGGAKLRIAEFPACD